MADKGEEIRMPQEHADYRAKPASVATQKDLSQHRNTPGHEDPLSRHALSYLKGGGDSGKTTWVIELFRLREALVFTPTHCLAKEKRKGPPGHKPTTRSSVGVARPSGPLKGWVMKKM
ncbi:MAG: hypothetical protein AB2556_25270 [Candidatus Thiodiazotropha sp.]